jgi:tetratricopeptide (TPR) repeat protein
MVEWIEMCQEKPALEKAERLETISADNPQEGMAYICRGVASWLRGFFEEALTELEQAIRLIPDEWDAYFWKGVTCASLRRDEEAIAAIEKSLELELPPILLVPLRWFEQERPDFYEKYVVALLANHA